MRRSWFTSGCAVLLLASALAACGGSDEPQQSGGTASASPDPRSPEQALLEQMVLTVDDLPPGMQRLNAAFNTNEEAAQGAEDPSAELSRLQAWGRQLGYRVTFLPGPDAQLNLVLGVESEVNLYDAAQGSGFSFTDDVTAARSTDVAAGYPQLNEVQVSELDPGSIGAERYWLRVSGFPKDDPTSLFVSDQLVFRVQRVKAFLRMDGQFQGDSDRAVYQEQVKRWAQLMSERIQQALAPG